MNENIRHSAEGSRKYQIQITPNFDAIPVELKAQNNWILWSAEPSSDGGKPRKIPRTSKGWMASTTKPEHWSSFTAVCAAYERGKARRSRKEREQYPDRDSIVTFSGIGYVFDGEIGKDGLVYVGVDIDDCIVGNELSTLATAILNKTSTYVELSPRGAGLHLIGKAKPLSRGLNSKELGLEIYSTGRYFTITGQQPIGYQDRLAVTEEITTFAEIETKIAEALGTTLLHAPRKTYCGIEFPPSFDMPREHFGYAEDNLTAGIECAENDLADVLEAGLAVANKRLVPGEAKPFYGHDKRVELGFAFLNFAVENPHLEDEAFGTYTTISQAAGNPAARDREWWDAEIPKAAHKYHDMMRAGRAPKTIATIFKMYSDGVNTGSISAHAGRAGDEISRKEQPREGDTVLLKDGYYSEGPDLCDRAARVEDKKQPTQPFQTHRLFRSYKQFMSEYRPLEYVIEGILVRGGVFTLTAKTGHAKTTLLASLAIAVGAGREDILGVKTKMGRVVYLTFENPENFRIQLAAAAAGHKIDEDVLDENLLIEDARLPVNDLCAELNHKDGDIALVVIDTLQAAFDGDDFNNNKQVLDFIIRTRAFTGLRGQPAVIIAAHPVKNAAVDNLLPYGGGSILNEVDGNLTLWRGEGTSITTLSWAGKFRGKTFDPVVFQIEYPECEFLDAEGRRLSPPCVKHIDSAMAAVIAAGQRDEVATKRLRLLQAIITSPKGSGADWSRTLEVHGITVTRQWANKLAKTLLDEGLIEKQGDAIVLTDKGREWLRENSIEKDGELFAKALGSRSIDETLADMDFLVADRRESDEASVGG